jgi:hypothetical protein
LKNSRDSGVSVIECGIAQFVEAVKVSGARCETAIFSYLNGSSGLGKTQLAFALNRKVLYIPLGELLYGCSTVSIVLFLLGIFLFCRQLPGDIQELCKNAHRCAGGCEN